MTITYDDYLRLLGLLTLAKDYNAKLDDILRAAEVITGEKPEFGGHTSDAVYGETSMSDLLKRLNITVEGDPDQ